jgi:hypothetical protein
MRIITSNPVVTSGGQAYSNVDDMAGPYAPGYTAPQSSGAPFSPEYIASQQSKGLTFDKIKGIWTKAQESGIIDKGKDLLGGLFGKPKKKPVPVSTSSGGSGGGKGKSKTKKGMSDTTKILIGVGVVAVLGFVIYKVSKK